MLIGRQAPLGVLALAITALGAQPALAYAEPASIARGGEQQLAELVKRYETTRSEVYKQMNATESIEERMKVYADAPWQPFVEGFREVAYESSGDTAVQAWIWVVRTGKEFFPDDAREAVDNLVAAHLDSKRITDLIGELAYPMELGSEYAEETLATIAAKSPEREVQATAQFRLATMLMGEGDGSEERRGRARELLTGMREDYEGILAEKELERTLYELDNLQIGMHAPDFEAIDADGAAFKLSDYRGKVVVVDFWGFW